MLEPLAKPRVNSSLRRLVDLIEEQSRINGGYFDITPLMVNLGLSFGTVTRHLNVLRRDYFWYMARLKDYTAGARYEVSDWPMYDTETGKPVLDPRWTKESPNITISKTSKVRSDFFNPPARGSSIGRVYWFLLDNRTPGTGVVHIGTLCNGDSVRPGMGAKKVHRIMAILRMKYGLEIKGAGQKYCFHVRKLRWQDPMRPVSKPLTDDAPERL